MTVGLSSISLVSLSLHLYRLPLPRAPHYPFFVVVVSLELLCDYAFSSWETILLSVPTLMQNKSLKEGGGGEVHHQCSSLSQNKWKCRESKYASASVEIRRGRWRVTKNRKIPHVRETHISVVFLEKRRRAGVHGHQARIYANNQHNEKLYYVCAICTKELLKCSPFNERECKVKKALSKAKEKTTTR